MDWHCKKHNTYGDKGWSCAICGYPLGSPIFVIDEKAKTIRKLKKIINLYFFKILIFETLPIHI